MAEPSGALQGHFARSRSISSRTTSGPGDEVGLSWIQSNDCINKRWQETCGCPWREMKFSYSDVSSVSFCTGNLTYPPRKTNIPWRNLTVSACGSNYFHCLWKWQYFVSKLVCHISTGHLSLCASGSLSKASQLENKQLHSQTFLPCNNNNLSNFTIHYFQPVNITYPTTPLEPHPANFNPINLIKSNALQLGKLLNQKWHTRYKSINL